MVYGIRTRHAEVYHYVGMTSSTNRLRQHLSEARKKISIGESSIFHDWLIEEPSVKELVVLERCSGRAIAHEKEVMWVGRRLEDGHPLLNLHHHPDPPAKFRCRTRPCKTLAFSSRRAAEQHAERFGHQVEKSSLVAWPFARDPDAPLKPQPVKRQRRKLFYPGVACDACGTPIPSRAFFAFEVSHFTNNGGTYRVCTTCDYNESQFEATDESGYNCVLAD